MRWVAAAPASLDWACWGDDCVLFHQPSGKTHFINAPTAQLLRALQASPLTLDEICARVELDEADAHELLWRLDELGLVQET
jgi:PqqD family protein of HPr-rel-A system